MWLSYRQMADLYATTTENIIQIVGRVLADGEVDESTTNSELVVRQEGSREVRREVKVFNLDMILAVGYRVTTQQAVMFRQWATTVLKEYLVKGFAMDDERLKNPGSEPDYFDEVAERTRAIRASEKRFYQKVCDLFVQTSSNYDKRSQMAKDFFATIQNKLLFPIAGHAAAELVWFLVVEKTHDVRHHRTRPALVTSLHFSLAPHNTIAPSRTATRRKSHPLDTHFVL